MQRKRLKIWIVALLIAVVGVIGGVLLFSGRTDAAEVQPIQFSHKLHVDNHVSCTTCHQGVETTRKAGLPGVLTCRKCHEDVIQVGPEERKIEQYFQANQEIPWQRVYRVPSYVFFSHRQHVVAGKVTCAACHGDVATRETPLTKPLVPIKMKTCIQCHQQRQVETNIDNVYACIRCHR